MHLSLLHFILNHFSFNRVRTTVPYKQNTDAPNTHTTAFENPGYDSASGLGIADEDIPPVVLSPYEDLNEFGAASNPVYAAIGLGNPYYLGGNSEGSDTFRIFDADNNPQKIPWDEKTEEASGVAKTKRVSLENGDAKQKATSKRVSFRVQDDKEKGPEEPGMPSEAGIRREKPVLILQDREVLGNNQSEM